jgi:hypothetical protein
MATGTVTMTPPVGFEATNSHIASGAVQEAEGPRAGRVRLGRGRNCSRFGPSVVGPHSFLSAPNSRPTAARTLSYVG